MSRPECASAACLMTISRQAVGPRRLAGHQDRSAHPVDHPAGNGEPVYATGWCLTARA
jgi:hypothetical protein